MRIFALRKRRDAGSFLKRRRGNSGVEKIFKKIFWKGGKDFYLCSPAGGKERDRRRDADGDEKKRGFRAVM
ncbi:hypothetical protein [Olivibacter domesticus]|uniref:hypothetical protein n=1 Tax=Olivibacter domesticus TaxID=407022 RepID=UPI001113D5FE|nr:hypothetical protein [Olivibacter domesticus]